MARRLDSFAVSENFRRQLIHPAITPLTLNRESMQEGAMWPITEPFPIEQKCLLNSTPLSSIPVLYYRIPSSHAMSPLVKQAGDLDAEVIDAPSGRCSERGRFLGGGK